MSPLAEQLGLSNEMQIWWDGESAHEKCIWVARVGEKLGFTAAQFVYAVEKPWKWKVEAWKLFRGIEL